MWLQPLLILTLISQSVSEQMDYTSKTINFIHSLNVPTKITLYGCDKNPMLWKNLTGLNHVNFVTKVELGWISAKHLNVIDLRCASSLKILQRAQEAKLFRTPIKWVLYGEADLSEFYFGVDSEVFWINPESGLESIYKLSPGSNFTRQSLKGYQTFSMIKRSNFQGVLITSSIVITNLNSLNHLEDYRDTHVDAISKLSYNIINNLLDYLNASRKFLVQRTWGYKNATTGLYTGMVGDMQTGDADLGGTALFFVPDRLDTIEYISPPVRTYVKFIFRAPPLTYVTNIFTLPFNSSVWHYCFIMVGVVVIFIYFIVWWEWEDVEFREVLDKHYDSLKPKFFDVCMMEIGAITQQGTDVEPQSVAGRIITIFTFLTLMFLYTAYSANIVALLQSTTDSIRTLEDLLNSRIKLGAEDIIYAKHYFEVAQEPVKKAIAEQIAPKGQNAHYMTAEEGIRLVREGFFAFHTECNTGYKIISKTFQEGEKCGLKEIEYTNFMEPWIAIPIYSPYRKVVKIGMRRMWEYGIQGRENRRIYSRKPQCHTAGSSFGSVGMIDCYAAFLIFGIGINVSVLLLILEVIARKISNRKNVSVE